MKKALFGMLLSAALVAQASAQSQEYFGKFLDSLRGAFNIAAKPRPTFKLENEFRFDDPNGLQWIAPAGIEVDGASIPQVFWSLVGGPFEGEYINASVIHDFYCRAKSRTAHDTHRNFYYGMRASGVPEWKATYMYWAVSTFGPDWKLTPRITFSQSCSTSTAGAITCASTPKVEVALVSKPPVDLSDPETLALAISKANAVAKTLLTSEGRVLDVSSSGEVLATLENVQANSSVYRKVFASADPYASPGKLGVLAGLDTGPEVSIAEPWAGNKLPKVTRTRVLTSRTAGALDAQMPFKVDSRSKGLVAEKVGLDSLGSSTILEAPK